MYRTPEEIDAIRNARAIHVASCECHPTKSVTLHSQALGRGLRKPWYIRKSRHIRSILVGSSIAIMCAAIGALWFAVGGA